MLSCWVSLINSHNKLAAGNEMVWGVASYCNALKLASSSSSSSSSSSPPSLSSSLFASLVFVFNCVFDDDDDDDDAAADDDVCGGRYSKCTVRYSPLPLLAFLPLRRMQLTFLKVLLRTQSIASLSRPSTWMPLPVCWWEVATASKEVAVPSPLPVEKAQV